MLYVVQHRQESSQLMTKSKKTVTKVPKIAFSRRKSRRSKFSRKLKMSMQQNVATNYDSNDSIVSETGVKFSSDILDDEDFPQPLIHHDFGKPRQAMMSFYENSLSTGN